MRNTPRMLRALTGAVALFFVACFAAPPAFAAPSLTISATEGLTDGQTVTISGKGFAPNMSPIAVGQCVEGYTGPAQCNTATGASFKSSDASGGFGEFTIKVAIKFGDYDCTKDKCVIAAAPLPTNVDQATYKANEVIYPITFGGAAAPVPTTAPVTAAAPAAGGEELPKTGPGEELALAVSLGAMLLLVGGATLWFVPRQRGGVA